MKDYYNLLERTVNGETESFVYDNNVISISKSGKQRLLKHHLYVCSEDSPELKRHIAFRDYLKTHPDVVLEYSRIKKEGALLYPYDIDKYIEHKSSFTESIYKEIGEGLL